MELIVHDLISNTPEWHAFRFEHDGASEIAAAMGLSKNVTRPELLHMKATGLPREFSDFVQKRILDKGHEVEALARPLVEAVIGDDLFPVTLSRGRQSASCDGLTMTGETGWENKQWNEAYAAMVRAGQMPEEHMPQVQQGLKVSGAKRWIFSISDGTPDKFVWMEVFPDKEWFSRIDATWVQFNSDRAAYVSPAAAEPLPTGRAPETLPALFIAVKGEVTESNLDEFKEVALSAIRSVNRDLKNDQDFADAEKAVKWCDDIEKRVAGAKQHTLSQTATIDKLFKTMDDISAEARQVRLDLEKLVKARKVSLKTEMLTEAQTALGDHIRSLNARLGRDYMPHVPVDFAGAITSKRNFDSMRAALDATLANAKIAANATADKIDANLKVLREQGKDHGFLFHDVSQIVLKAPDDLQALVTLRISEHKAAELVKEQETRDRIRKEEQTNLANSQIEGIRQQVMIASIGRAGVRQGGTIECIRETLAETEAWVIDEAQFGAEHVARAQSAKDGAVSSIRRLLQDAESKAAQAAAEPATPAPAAVVAQAPAAAPTPAANVVPMRAAAPAPAPAAAPATPPTMKLGDINALLSPISLTADGLTKLGFPPAAVAQSAKLYHAHDLTNICAALHDLLDRVQAKQAA